MKDILADPGIRLGKRFQFLDLYIKENLLQNLQGTFNSQSIVYYTVSLAFE